MRIDEQLPPPQRARCEPHTGDEVFEHSPGADPVVVMGRGENAEQAERKLLAQPVSERHVLGWSHVRATAGWVVGSTGLITGNSLGVQAIAPNPYECLKSYDRPLGLEKGTSKVTARSTQ